MKAYLKLYVLLVALMSLFTSCATQAPRLDYAALAKASLRLNMNIDLQDNHKLYMEASRWIGVPYRSGGHSQHGTDCSGLVSQIYRKVYRISLPRNSEDMRKKCLKINKRNLREGDLVFFSSRHSKKKTGHVGIYLKNDKFIHASSSHGVIISSLKEAYYKKHWIQGGRMIK